MLPRLTINTRPKSLDHYTDWCFFAVDLGLNLSCFVGPIWGQGLVFSEKKQQPREIPDKAAPGLCRFVYIKKTLVFLSGARDNISRFQTEN